MSKDWIATCTNFGPMRPLTDHDKIEWPTQDQLWPEMKVEYFKILGVWVRNAAAFLGLRDWEIMLSYNSLEEDSDAYATIHVVENQKRARINMMKDFAYIPEPEQRRALTHELMHCHLDHLEDFLRMPLHSQLGSSAASVLLSVLHSHIEKTTDAIATELATVMPPIESGLEEGEYENVGPIHAVE